MAVEAGRDSGFFKFGAAVIQVNRKPMVYNV
jgi:hypothetical protein